MEKDILVLADGTKITLESSQGIGALHVNAENRQEACRIWGGLTKDSLKQVRIENSGGVTTGRYDDLILDHITGTDNADGTVHLTLCMRGKTENEILRDKIAALEAGQQTHDAAIGDLGQALSDVMGGVQ